MGPGGAVLNGLDRLPHGPAARWVREIVTVGADTIVCSGNPPQTSPFVRRGRYPAFASLEFAAQAAALLEAVQPPPGVSDGSPGYLVRARNIRCSAQELSAGVPIRVEVRGAGAAPPLHTYDVFVTAAGRSILEGSIAIFIDRRDPATRG